MQNLIGRAQAFSWNDFKIFESPISSSIGLSDILTRIVNWVLILAGMIAIVYLIYGGILYITAGGDAEKATKGRTAVINAVIGIAIILLALAIVTWVKRLIVSGNP